MTKHILIIDDEEGIQSVARVGLKMEAGWEVMSASSGKEGIAVAQAQPLDAILLDVTMPEMDGITTFRRLQANPVTQAIPVIFLTAKVQASKGGQFESTGAAGIITKPFDVLTLGQQIAKLLGWQGD